MLAYAGYVLTVRDMARVDGGAEMSVRLSAEAVVGGFGVFAATRASGGFAVDYWAFRRTGADRREAIARVLGLGFLEYAISRWPHSSPRPCSISTSTEVPGTA